MDNLTLFTIILSIVSIVMSIFSLVLSILFYIWSKKSNDDIQKSGIHIDHNTKEIQKLFDTFYSDTFSMMKNTVTAMQNRIFSENTDSDISKAEIIKEANSIIPTTAESK